MEYINKIRLLGIFVFIIPVAAINLCLYLVIDIHIWCDFLSELTNQPLCDKAIKGAIGPVFPYIDGGVSISRTARVFPTYWIFKPAMFLTAYLLVLYWIYNFRLMNKIDDLIKLNKYFIFFGILSAIFLILHSIFLGIKIDIPIYKVFRRFIILSFIICELVAQCILTTNLFKIKNKIEGKFSKLILKFKIFLVTTLTLVALASIPFVTTSGHKVFKHVLEWNFFLAICFFYFLPERVSKL